MAQQYAKDQPQGFINRVQRVAVVGAGGTVGLYLTEALLRTGNHEVTAITRADSKSKLPDGVKVAQVDYNDEDSIANALEGHQFLVISMSAFAPPGTTTTLVNAAAKAGIRWIMPNCYGTDITNLKLVEENQTARSVLPGIKAIEATGTASWIAIACSFWYEYSIAQGAAWYGFDFANKKITFYDDGKTKINTSTWDQCGRAIAALLSLKIYPEDENDKSTTISHWKNKPMFISSFFASQRDMLDSIQRVLGETDKDWTIEYEPSEARWKRGLDLLKAGDHSGFALALYSRTFFPNGDGDIQAKHGLDNDLLGLPKEDMDEASKRALDLVQKGYNYFGTRNR